MAFLRRGLARFLRIYLGYFLLITAIVAVIYGIEAGGVGTIAVCLVIAAVLVTLAGRVTGVHWPRRTRHDGR
jgi:sugar phosphate permease